MQYYKLNKIGECEIKRQTFKPSLPKFPSSRKLERFKHTHRPYMLNLATKKNFATKSILKETPGLITIICMLTKWKDVSFPQKLKLEENFHALVS